MAQQHDREHDRDPRGSREYRGTEGEPTAGRSVASPVASPVAPASGRVATEVAIAGRVGGIPANPFAVSDVRVRKAQAAGADVIDLSKGNPDGEPPEFMLDAAVTAVRDRANFRYPAFAGKPAFLQAAARWYARQYGVALEPASELLAVAGAGVGISEVIEALIDPGDLVVMIDPYYPQYRGSTAVAQGRIHLVEAQPELGFLPDLQAVPERVWDEAKLLILNYPNNPTGAAATPELFAMAVRLAKAHHFTVMHDFAYAGIGFDAHPPISLLQTPGALDVGVELCSLSKMYMVAGWRAGFVACRPELMAAVRVVHEQTSLLVTSVVQDAGAAGLNSDQASVRALAERYAGRYETLRDGLSRAGLELVQSHGGLFGWLRVPDGWSDQDFALWLLAHPHVAAIPGSDFGPAGASYVRLSLLVPESVLHRAAERIARARGDAW